MNEEQQKQRKRQRLLLPVSVLIILLFLIVGLVLAYQVAQRRLMPGGPTLVFRVTPPNGVDAAPLRSNTMRIMRDRLELKQSRVRPGAEVDEIEVLLPQIPEDLLERIRHRLLAPGTMAIYKIVLSKGALAKAAEGAVDNGHAAFLRQADGSYARAKLPFENAPKTWMDGTQDMSSPAGAILVATPPAFTQDDMKRDAFRVQMDARGNKAIAFELDDDKRASFLTFTEREVGNPLALALNNLIISTPVVQTSIPGKGIIAGSNGFTLRYAADVVLLLRSGPYPVPPTFVKLIPAPGKDGETRVPTTTEEADSSNGQ